MKLLTIQQTAEILKVTPQWLYQLARAGNLPIVRLGRNVRVDEGRLRKWLNGGGFTGKGTTSLGSR